MKALTGIVFLIIGLSSGWGCTPSFIYNPEPTVYLRRDIPRREIPARLVVLPFESPSYCSGIGIYASSLFYREILKRKVFSDVTLSEDTGWYEKGAGWLGKTGEAVQAGRAAAADYILIGQIDYYLVGHTTTNRVTVTVRLIEVSSGEPAYFATGYGSGKPGKTYLLLGATGGEYTPGTTAVLSAVVERMVRDCFKKRWFGFI